MDSGSWGSCRLVRGGHIATTTDTATPPRWSSSWKTIDTTSSKNSRITRSTRTGTPCSRSYSRSGARARSLVLSKPLPIGPISALTSLAGRTSPSYPTSGSTAQRPYAFRSCRLTRSGGARISAEAPTTAQSGPPRSLRQHGSVVHGTGTPPTHMGTRPPVCLLPVSHCRTLARLHPVVHTTGTHLVATPGSDVRSYRVSMGIQPGCRRSSPFDQTTPPDMHYATMHYVDDFWGVEPNTHSTSGFEAFTEFSGLRMKPNKAQPRQTTRNY